MNLNQLDLNLLVALEALLTERNVSRAGDRLGLSQPVMSRSLGRLRRLFNDELLVRVGTEYHLTALGAELVGPVQGILHLVEQTLERKLEFRPKTDHRTFRIATGEHIVHLLLKPLLTNWAKSAPNLTIQIRTVTGRGTIQEIDSGEVDLGIWSVRVDPGHLEKEYVFEDRMVPVISRHSSFRPQTSDDLRSMRRIEHYRNPRDVTGLIAANKVISPENIEANVWVEHRLDQLLLLARTDFMTITYEKFARLFEGMLELEVLSDLPQDTLPQAMYWHPRASEDPAHIWLREQIRTHALSL